MHFRQECYVSDAVSSSKHCIMRQMMSICSLLVMLTLKVYLLFEMNKQSVIGTVSLCKYPVPPQIFYSMVLIPW